MHDRLKQFDGTLLDVVCLAFESPREVKYGREVYRQVVHQASRAWGSASSVQLELRGLRDDAGHGAPFVQSAPNPRNKSFQGQKLQRSPRGQWRTLYSQWPMRGVSPQKSQGASEPHWPQTRTCWNAPAPQKACDTKMGQTRRNCRYLCEGEKERSHRRSRGAPAASIGVWATLPSKLKARTPGEEYRKGQSIQGRVGAVLRVSRTPRLKEGSTTLPPRCLLFISIITLM